jgi:hypothetical protein
MDLQAYEVCEVCSGCLLLGENAQGIQERVDGIWHVCRYKEERRVTMVICVAHMPTFVTEIEVLRVINMKNACLI